MSEGPDRRGITKTNAAYQALRRSIVNGEIEAEQALDEHLLMARFGLGRTPLREALHRLVAEQLVVWPAHRTPFVRTLSVSDLRSVYEARLVVEAPIAALAAQRHTEQERSRLRDAAQRLKADVESGDIYQAVESDHDLHATIAGLSHNRYLADSIKILNCGSLRMWYLTNDQLGMDGLYERHAPLVEAISAGDSERAVREMKEHIVRSHERQMLLHRLAPEDLHIN